MWDEIKEYLNNIEHPYKLYVNIGGYIPNELPSDFNWREYLRLCPDLSLNNLLTKDKVTKHFLRFGIREGRNYKQTQIDIITKIKSYKDNSVIIKSPNKGMDIGGFLHTYKQVDPDTDIILKIHTKKGLGDTANPSNALKRYGIDKAKKIGEDWFKNLMNGVLKNKNQVNNIINEFTLNPKCGMIGFKLNNNYDINHMEMEKIYDLINVHPTGKNPFFVGGTTFWVSNIVMKKYFTNENIDKILDVLPYGYVPEPSPNHAMERIFGCFVYNEKKEIKIII
jgi:lipopolysaccharide biosynthesis protein